MKVDPESLAEQKALLCARAELDRTRLAFALREVIMVVVPEPGALGAASQRPAIGTFISFLASVFGPKQVTRWIRFASLALTVIRFVRGWRGSR